MSEPQLPIYMFSGEGRRLDLPVEVRIARYLSLAGVERKAAVLTFAHSVYRARLREAAVVAKGIELVSDVLRGAQVGVYLMPIDARVCETEIDLKDGLQPVVDWCELTLDESYARKAQEQVNAA